MTSSLVGMSSSLTCRISMHEWIRVIEKKANGLSPWNIVHQRDIQTQAGDRIAFDLVGRTILDYFDLYQKFTYVNQESYKLDHIAFG